MLDIFMVFGVLATFAFVVRQVTRLISTWMLHQTIREALKAHPESVAELSIQLHSHTPREHPLFGWVAIALAVTIAILSLFQDQAERLVLLQIAVVPLIIGLATIAYLWISRRREESL